MDIIDIMEDLSGSINQFGVELMNKYRSITQKRTLPTITDELKKYPVLFMEEFNKHVTSEIFQLVTAFSFSNNNTDNSYDGWGFTRKIPSSVIAYGITHTEYGTTLVYVTENGLRLANNDGANYEKLDPYNSAPDMDIGTSGFGIAFLIKKTTSGTYGVLCKKNIAAAANAGIELWIDGTNINIRIADGTNNTLLTVNVANLNDGNLHSVIVNVPDTGNLEIFVDKVSKGTQARGSVASVTNTRSCYVWARDNAGTIQDKMSGKYAWLCWKREIFSAQDITDYHDIHLLNYKSASNTEVTTIPYLGDRTPYPNCLEGGFIA